MTETMAGVKGVKAKAGSFQSMGLEKDILIGLNRMGYKVALKYLVIMTFILGSNSSTTESSTHRNSRNGFSMYGENWFR